MIALFGLVAEVERFYGRKIILADPGSATLLGLR
jgi:hypothetical protein